MACPDFDYVLYCDGKIVGLICDNNLYLKQTKAGKPLLISEDMILLTRNIEKIFGRYGVNVNGLAVKNGHFRC